MWFYFHQKNDRHSGKKLAMQQPCSSLNGESLRRNHPFFSTEAITQLKAPQRLQTITG